jgi:hypothetical protein
MVELGVVVAGSGSDVEGGFPVVGTRDWQITARRTNLRYTIRDRNIQK